jgi:REP element-mobilizing transposase RayT
MNNIRDDVLSYTNLLKGRFSEPNRAYFVTTVTYGRQPIFLDLYCARDLVHCIKSIHESGKACSLSWVIMPDHFHWLLQLNDSTLSAVMNELKGISSRRINQRMSISGRIWQKSYFDRAIRDDENIRQIARYIVANPLRAGLAENIGDYSHWDAIWL